MVGAEVMRSLAALSPPVAHVRHCLQVCKRGAGGTRRAVCTCACARAGMCSGCLLWVGINSALGRDGGSPSS